MITSQNILTHEFIGLHTKIIQSTNESLVGLCGLVSFETKSMFHFANTNKQIPKSICTFEFTLPDGNNVLVDGKKIIKRPQDRNRIIQ